MIHTASLLHDDVIDLSLTRRSQPSANAEYGNKMAILAGDFLLARASLALARLQNVQVVELLATVISNLVEGEFMQLRAKHDIHSLVAMIEEHIRLIGSTKIAFNSRAKAYSTWQTCETQLVKKTENWEKLKSTQRIRTDKVEAAQAEVSEVRSL